MQSKRVKQEINVITANGLDRNALRHYRYNEGYLGKFSKSQTSSGISLDGDKDVNNLTSLSSASSSSSSSSTSPKICSKKAFYCIEYPRKSLELIEILGEGNFGQVWKAKVTHLRESHYVAVKTNKGIYG